LIAYQTKGGVTAENAQIIAGILREDYGHQVDVVDLKVKKDPDLAPYQNVVLGAGVRIQRPYGRAKRFIKDRRLTEKRVAIFFSSGMAGSDPEGATAKWEKKLLRKTPYLRPVACQAFGGRMPKGRGPDWTDPEKVREWAHCLGEILASPAS
jgi:menaquinone-dependent protoporphyrinogen IX oxidase